MKLLIRVYLWMSWTLLIGGLIAWPITALTIFSEEPPGILGLSWAALIFAALGNVIAADIRKEQEKS